MKDSIEVPIQRSLSTGVRPVEIHGHHIEMQGFFHAWGIVNQESVAIVESEDGSIASYVVNHYRIRFTDR